MTLQWYPERLTAAIQRAYAESLKVAEAEAEAAKPSSKVKVGLSGDALTAEPAFFEKGAGPHEIDPGSKGFLALKGDNAFVSGPVHHPGSPPQPHIGPASVAWATRTFQAVARATLAAAGFR